MSTDKTPKEKKPNLRQVQKHLLHLQDELARAAGVYGEFSRQLETAERGKAEALATQVELLKAISETEKAYRIAAGVSPEAEKEAYGAAYGSACHG